MKPDFYIMRVIQGGWIVRRKTGEIIQFFNNVDDARVLLRRLLGK